MTTSQQLCLSDIGVVTTRGNLNAHSGLIEGLDSVLQDNDASTIVRITPIDLLCRLDGARKLLAAGCRLVLLDGSLSSLDELQAALGQSSQTIVFNRSVPGFETRSLSDAHYAEGIRGYSLGVQAGKLALGFLHRAGPVAEPIAEPMPKILGEPLSSVKKITRREKQCLQWIANGKTSKEIATLLAIAETTVNFHLRNAFTKLNASNRVHLVAKAVALGIVSPVQ